MNRRCAGVIVLFSALLLLCGAALWLPSPTVSASSGPETAAPVKPLPANDRACAGCHQAIYDHYQKTSMARGSGPATDGMLTGGFTHALSGVTYQVTSAGGHPVMSYARPAAAQQAALAGQRDLRLYVGSNHRGRTYLYQQDGLWFEVPINFYAKKAIWDMAPNYGASHTLPDGLPVDTNCLHCHATDVQPSLPGARNRFASAPFVAGGIGCASCHGDPAAHLAHPSAGNIVNPAKLTASRRDGVCLQCHLEGDAEIYRANRTLADFRAGQDLPDFVAYFVRAGAEDGGGRAGSQYEALLRSRCKQASGDRMTCTSCHDPHSTPTAAERVGFYRAKCLTCHTDQAIAVEHHPEQPDCTTCHMPARSTVDISHEQTTDHSIRARPRTSSPALSSLDTRPLDTPSFRLVTVGNLPAGVRETGLAYAQMAIAGRQAALAPALKNLEQAEAAGASDVELHAQLGLVEQLAGHQAKALAEYERALAADPANATALGNKAVLDASAGNVAAAVHALRTVLQNDPSQVSAGLNLAYIECVVGDKDAARTVLNGLLRFHPDNRAVHGLLDQGTYAGRRCDLRVSAK